MTKGSTGYERHSEGAVSIPASALQVFSFIDDHARLASHMKKSSWMTGGGRMNVTMDSQHGQATGSHITMSGKAFGLRLFLDEVVTSHEPPHRKTWETVGLPKLVVIGRYGMGVDIREHGKASSLRVWIDYDLPPQRWGRLVGPIYARWCVNQMLNDTRAPFTDAPRRT